MSRKRKARRRTVKGMDRSSSARQSNQLSFDQLEARNLLATLVVNSTADLPVDLTDSVVTLRDAIEAANNDVLVAPGGETGNGVDTITFDASVFTGGSSSLIRLNGTELEITEELTIDGTTGVGVTITGDAFNDDVTDSLNVTNVGASFGGTAGAFNDLLDDNSRVLNFSSASGDLTLDGVTVTGGRIMSNNALIGGVPETTESGGGIRFASNGLLSINNSVISGNSTSGVLGNGGGVFTYLGDLTLTSSTLSGNNTSGSAALGGGVFTVGGDVILTDSTLSGNSTSGDYAAGGGVFAFYGDVSLTDSTLSGSSTSGFFSEGGGVFTSSGDVTLINSTLSGNSTSGAGGSGAGVFTSSGDVSLINSTLSDNSTTGYGAIAGGVRTSTGNVSLVNSTLSGNSTSGDIADGGGIFTDFGDVSLLNSTLSGNSVSGAYAYAGGIRTFSSAVTLTNSTLSGNSTSGTNGLGGGIFTAYGDVILESSTVTGNESALASGGGVYIVSYNQQPSLLTIENSIVAGNLSSVTSSNARDGNEFFLGANVQLTVNDSLIGATDLAIGGTGNQVGTSVNPVNPLLGPLADNGGRTQTHALLAGSPAINAGNDSVTQTEDQRGLARNFNGVDIGAFELQPAGPPTVTSFTRDEGGVLARPDLLSTISVTFDVDVSVSVDDLEIRNDTLGGSLVDTTGLIFSYNASTRTATWDFSNLTLDAGFYSFELTSGIVSAGGNIILDGDANGTPGGAFIEPIYVAIPGDANFDGQVDVLGDAFILINNLGVTGDTFAQGDFNGSGDVNVLGDAFILVNNLGQSVVEPTGNPPLVTSFTRDEGGVLDRPDLLSTVSVSFDVDVSIGVDDLEIRNDTLGGSLVDTSGLIFSYDSSTRTATWDFGSLTLAPAFYSFELTSGIVSAVGNASLDGDADGNPGGAYTEPVYVALPGDANLDGVVDVLGDAFILVNNLGATGRTFTQGDFDGSGTVDVLGDAFILVNNLGQSVQLPATSQAFVQPPLAAIASAPSVSTSAAVVIEQADDEDEVVATAPRVAANATSPELSGDEVRDDAFASEFGSLDSFWV